MRTDMLIGHFGMEALYSFVIIVCSLMIYASTKELYALSNHKGIKYFRLAFLFLAFAYTARIFTKFLIHYLSLTRIIDIPHNSTHFIAGQLSTIASTYFSAIAILFLLYSIIHKHWKNDKNKIYIIHALAITLTIPIITHNPLSHLIINLILLLLIILAFIISKRTSKNSLHLIYSLIIIFWTTNILDIIVPNFLKGFQLLIYLISLTIFLTILYKVLKRTGMT
jgi:hypothetical protein